MKGVTIDTATGMVKVDGESIEPPLTDLEYQLLLSCYNNDGAILSKKQITSRVWRDNSAIAHDDRIYKLISRLRQRIETNPSDPIYLRNVRGRGYRFNKKGVVLSLDDEPQAGEGASDE